MKKKVIASTLLTATLLAYSPGSSKIQDPDYSKLNDLIIEQTDNRLKEDGYEVLEVFESDCLTNMFNVPLKLAIVSKDGKQGLIALNNNLDNNYSIMVNCEYDEITKPYKVSNEDNYIVLINAKKKTLDEEKIYDTHNEVFPDIVEVIRHYAYKDYKYDLIEIDRKDLQATKVLENKAYINDEMIYKTDKTSKNLIVTYFNELPTRDMWTENRKHVIPAPPENIDPNPHHQISAYMPELAQYNVNQKSTNVLFYDNEYYNHKLESDGYEIMKFPHDTHITVRQYFEKTRIFPMINNETEESLMEKYLDWNINKWMPYIDEYGNEFNSYAFKANINRENFKKYNHLLYFENIGYFSMDRGNTVGNYDWDCFISAYKLYNEAKKMIEEDDPYMYNVKGRVDIVKNSLTTSKYYYMAALRNLIEKDIIRGLDIKDFEQYQVEPVKFDYLYDYMNGNSDLPSIELETNRHFHI